VIEMLGLMQHHELTVDEFLAHAERWYGSTEVVTRLADGAIKRFDYAAIARTARQISAVLTGLGIRQGDRIATLRLSRYNLSVFPHVQRRPVHASGLSCVLRCPAQCPPTACLDVLQHHFREAQKHQEPLVHRGAIPPK
jgi:hypothetical protein